MILLDWKQNVAFITVLASSYKNLSDTALIFTRIISNIGDGYNENTGIFCAPMAGTYVFNVNAYQHKNTKCVLNIVLNDESNNQAKGQFTNPEQTGTNMVLLILRKGDHVWVMQQHCYHSKDVEYSAVPLLTFSGFMI